MDIGYARVSTRDQRLDSQQEALVHSGCEKVFAEVASGTRSDRPVLADAVEFARPGDTIVCCRLDIARSVSDLTSLLRELDDRGIGFRSLGEAIDTTTPGGRLAMHIFGALAEFEAALIRERTQAGLHAARSRGRVGGRPRAMNSEKIEAAKRLLGSGTPAREVAIALGVSTATLYRYVPASGPERPFHPS